MIDIRRPSCVAEGIGGQLVELAVGFQPHAVEALIAVQHASSVVEGRDRVHAYLFAPGTSLQVI